MPAENLAKTIWHWTIQSSFKWGSFINWIVILRAWLSLRERKIGICKILCPKKKNCICDEDSNRCIDTLENMCRQKCLMWFLVKLFHHQDTDECVSCCKDQAMVSSTKETLYVLCMYRANISYMNVIPYTHWLHGTISCSDVFTFMESLESMKFPCNIVAEVMAVLVCSWWYSVPTDYKGSQRLL